MLLATILSLFLTYAVVLVVYRVWLSPVAHIPGPFLARATYWYEFYYDVILNGRYTFKVRELHEKYGPIIRVNPEEIHIHDADFYDEIYAGPSRKRNRWAWSTGSFSFSSAVITAIDGDDHRRKRAPISPYFSKAKVRALQPAIEDGIHKLLGRFEEYRITGQPLPLDAAMFALSNDNIMQYAFGRSYDRLAQKDFDPIFHKASVAALRSAHTIKHLPVIQFIINMIPEKVLQAKIPEMAGFIHLQRDIKFQVTEKQNAPAMRSEKQTQTTIFDELLEVKNSSLTNSFSYLWENGVVIVFGATATTATAMYITIFHLLQNQRCMKRLRDELASFCMREGHVTTPDLTRMEQLPYLTAVIKEGLRMSGTVTTRLQRIDPVAPVAYVDARKDLTKSYVIPPGTPMSSTVLLIHFDPRYYPDPYQFTPERWLAEDGNIPPLERYFVPFQKGTMNCVGMNLAWAEIYLLLFHLFKPGAYGCTGAQLEGDMGNLDLFETEYRDIELVGDALGPMYRSDSRGVRIVVRP